MPTFEEKKREVDSNSPKEDDNLGILEYGESMFSVTVENGNRTVKRSVDWRSLQTNHLQEESPGVAAVVGP